MKTDLTKSLLLAAISSGVACEEVIRRTHEQAVALNCRWLAVYVEILGATTEAEQAQIARALALARELGAEVITATSGDVVDGIVRIVRQYNATRIIIAKPPPSRWRLLPRDSILDRLLNESGGVDVHVITHDQSERARHSSRRQAFDESKGSHYLLSITVVLMVTVITSLLGSDLGPPHAIALVFLLAVVALGSFVGRGPTLLAALLSALLWDFFILPPVFVFSMSHFEDGLVFGMYFIVAAFMGQLTTRIRTQERIERLGEERATALYLLTRELTEASTVDQIIETTAQQIDRVFHAKIAVLFSSLPPSADQPLHAASTFTPVANDRAAIAWVIEHRQRAGRFTINLNAAEALYVPLVNDEGLAGVLGFQFSQAFSPTVHQLNLLDSFLEQIVLALDRKRLSQVSERAKVLAESERLTKTLLDSMSHEVCTPIAAIVGATSILAELEASETQPVQKEMVAEIQEATDRLNRLVENFLEISHLESGAVKPNIEDCEVSDMVYTVLSDMEKPLSAYQVSVDIPGEFPLVAMDFVLTQFALTNLLSNVVLHTPPGTPVEVTAAIEKEELTLTVADRGPGIPPVSLKRIFDKFYRAANAPDGGSGLGLSLVKGFMEAQGGSVNAFNREGGGAAFILRLPHKPKMIVAGQEYD